jgi:hypothetical protein
MSLLGALPKMKDGDYAEAVGKADRLKFLSLKISGVAKMKSISAHLLLVHLPRSDWPPLFATDLQYLDYWFTCKGTITRSPSRWDQQRRLTER